MAKKKEVSETALVKSALDKVNDDIENWQNTVLVQSIAKGIQDKWHALLGQIANGKARNNNYNKGYMQACRDIQAQLTHIVEPTEELKTDE